MKKYSLFLLAFAVFAWVSISVQADAPPVFYESFSKMNMEFIETNGAIKMDDNFDDYFDNPGWTGQKMYYGYRRVTESELFVEFNECAFPRFGNTKTDSYLITPSLDITGGVSVSFKVKSFIRNAGGEPTIENPEMKVEYAADGSTFEDIFSVHNMDGVLSEKTFTISADKATATAKIKFNRVTSDQNNRFFISDILILKMNPSSTDEIQEKGLQVYPVEGGVVVQTSASFPAQIYAVTGALVKDISVSDDGFIPLDKGIYIVRIAGKSVKVSVR